MVALRLGIIGAGGMGALHARAATDVAGVEVGAVCDVNPGVGQRLAGECGVAFFRGHRDLIGSGAVDAVLINTPPATHAGIAVDAAAAGVHVLVEKPMATTVADCDAMIRACDGADVTLAVGHPQRFFADRQALKTAVDAGRIGALRLVLDNRLADYHEPSRPSWCLAPDLAGGGVLFNIGAHSIDRTIWLSGQHPSRVEATLVRRDGFAVETDASARIALSGGAIAQVAVTGRGSFPRDEITVIGDDGVLRYSREGGVVLSRGREETLLHPAGHDGTPWADQLAEFARAINDRRAPAVPGAHGREVVATILAAYRSAETGHAEVQPAPPGPGREG